MRSRSVLFFCTILIFSFTEKAVADEVYLKNGDHITGQVISMEEGKLIFESPLEGVAKVTYCN